MRNQGRYGFTLVELMVAVFVLAVFIAGTYKLVVGALWMNQTARDHYVAINLANSRMERARVLLYSDYSKLAENNLVMDANGVPNPGGPYRRTTTVNTNYGANLTEFFVKVDIRNHKSGTFDGPNEQLATVLPSKQ
jgi:prepilin-type N-terminal cleavage/methylation domain-containing protein